MTIALEDVLEVSFVLAGARLLQEPNQREQFALRVGADVETNVAPDPTTSFPGIASTNITPTTEFELLLQKERVLVQVSSNTIFRRHYSDHVGLERLADVAHLAIECSESAYLPVQAYGCNVNAVFTQDENVSSQAFMAANLFSSKLAKLGDWQIIGGNGRLVYQAGIHTLTFRAEPRVNDISERRIFLNLNLHTDAQIMPTKELIWKSLQLAWQSTDLLARTLVT